MSLATTYHGSKPSPETLMVLSELIAFQTVSRDSNLGLIEWVRDYLQSLGASIRLTYDRSKKKANLFATYGEGPDFGTVFSGHTDVVPTDGQDWNSHPFIATLKGDRVFGRGTCDMKGFLAVCLSRLRVIPRQHVHTPIHFSFSYDEELGCLGVRGLLDDLKAHDIRPVACIVGEPTMMQPVLAHKGKRAYRCSVHGHSAHSSSPQLAINAVDFGAELIVKIREVAERVRASGPLDEAFDVPYSTIVTTVVQGGNVINTIPDRCEFVFEHRFLPGVDPQQVMDELNRYIDRDMLPRMRLEAGRAGAADAIGGVKFDVLSAYPGLETTVADQLARRAMHILGVERANKVGFGTEAGLFSAAGIPALVCGPGDIAHAHKPNEFVTLDQLARCEAFFDAYVKATSMTQVAVGGAA
ncbi:acetylornithine deacetylase [Herbaspirillum rubrisubalbicans]|uniref:Acetylornithine deacetylase n=1 Tax=Herbaspirillum rubrisubalbicans TaxID=80842 RepID=A0ABX9BZY9_9BURK|nr:acetylornithine deacetylase [Herbaspirillum rubrisubalbicans]RAM63624.1 acetylornithine deacetylase [Herbaspirillum rubrisubalbicans]